MATKETPIEDRDAWEERNSMTGFFNISSMAQKRISEKRRKKGLGEIKPREKNVYGQIFVYGVTLGAAKTVGAPLERVRILLQTRHMQNLKAQEKLSTAGIISSKLAFESNSDRDLFRAGFEPVLARQQCKPLQDNFATLHESLSLRQSQELFHAIRLTQVQGG